MTDLQPLLAKNPFFEGFSPEHLAFVVSCAANVVHTDGQYLFRENGVADSFYIVRHGQVALEAFAPGKGAVTVATADEGEPVGWSWLVPPHQWHFSARCVGPVRLLGFDGACLRRKCEQDPTFGYRLMSRIAELMEQRLTASIVQMLDVYDARRR